MIEKEDVLQLMKEELHPLSFQEIYEKLDFEEDMLLKILGSMEAKGEIILTRREKYGLPAQMNLMVGRIQRNQKGFGFLIPDSLNEEDVYIRARDLSGALNNDRVIVRLSKQLEEGKRQEGKVIRILERVNTKIVGTFEKGKGFGFVIPDDTKLGSDLFISKKYFNGAKDGMKVVAEIIDWPEKSRNPEAKIIEVIGQKGDPGIDIISIVKKHQLQEDFPNKIKKFIDRQDYTIADEEIDRRKDLRKVPMVTIDGADAKDLDDAVSLEILENGNFDLGVHIADVGQYVKEGSLLDQEALKRGTSVYLVDRVIPMLPKELSNGICSLNPREDRLTLTCQMEINPEGKVVDYEVFESVINVDERMTYSDVNKIIEEDDSELKLRYDDFVDTFNKMSGLRDILKQRRITRGSIDFDFPESKVILDELGNPVDIVLRERRKAESLIEEFMLIANETVAEHYFSLEIPFVYRVHEEPELKKITELTEFLKIFGYYIKGVQNKPHPKAFQEVVDKVSGKNEEKTITTLMLRTMRHARYSTEPLGHFGLSAKYYSHFTSPIRRYPDLAIHRVIKEMAAKNKKLGSKRIKELKESLAEYSEQSSMREIIAEEAERESVDLKKVEYMSQFIGEEFDGVISSVTSFGLFVEIKSIVEGLIHISMMDDDYYNYDERILALIGERTGKTYTIGDEVKVVLVKADSETRQIDFEFAKI